MDTSVINDKPTTLELIEKRVHACSSSMAKTMKLLILASSDCYDEKEALRKENEELKAVIKELRN